MKIVKMEKEDWPSVAGIYKEGIETGFATFEQSIPSFDIWNVAHMNACRFVVKDNKKVIGWAALSPVSSRCVYGGVAEVSVYVGMANWGCGVGKLLLSKLIYESEKIGIWTLQSGIFPQNKGSIRLHKSVGFRKIGKRERIGKLNNIWYDNLLFERRSNKVGIS